MNEIKFVIGYDDQPDDIVSTISNALKQFDLRITECDGGDGYQEYKIIKREQK